MGAEKQAGAAPTTAVIVERLHYAREEMEAARSDTTRRPEAVGALLMVAGDARKAGLPEVQERVASATRAFERFDHDAAHDALSEALGIVAGGGAAPSVSVH